MKLGKMMLLTLVAIGICTPLATIVNACPTDPNNLPAGSGYLEPGKTTCVTDPDLGTVCGKLGNKGAFKKLVGLKDTRKEKRTNPEMRPVNKSTYLQTKYSSKISKRSTDGQHFRR